MTVLLALWRASRLAGEMLVLGGSALPLVAWVTGLTGHWMAARKLSMVALLAALAIPAADAFETALLVLLSEHVPATDVTFSWRLSRFEFSAVYGAFFALMALGVRLVANKRLAGDRHGSVLVSGVLTGMVASFSVGAVFCVWVLATWKGPPSLPQHEVVRRLASGAVLAGVLGSVLTFPLAIAWHAGSARRH